ncbi:YceI family protein [Nibrella viscosa]|uniref:YceI family protein n=1 Tax=Nibrella viscosa TaxID=1084524 RepID=A0ABP8KVH6_9BACT
MNFRTILLSASVAVLSLGFTPNTPKAVEYKADKQQTKITWLGKKVTGEHNGSISLADGKLTTKGNTITGGIFTIDMTSITNADLTDAGYNQKLVGHLKSDDFFGTEKYPTSTLVLTKVTPTGKNQYKVTGDLTIKGIKKPVEFPATITMDGNQLRGKAKLVVDRTKYDIRYGSGSFFDNLGDKAINNDFELTIDLVAVKAGNTVSTASVK